VLQLSIVGYTTAGDSILSAWLAKEDVTVSRRDVTLAKRTVHLAISWEGIHVLLICLYVLLAMKAHRTTVGQLLLLVA
jgi:hypothetical protein